MLYASEHSDNEFFHTNDQVPSLRQPLNYCQTIHCISIRPDHFAMGKCPFKLCLRHPFALIFPAHELWTAWNCRNEIHWISKFTFLSIWSQCVLLNNYNKIYWIWVKQHKYIHSSCYWTESWTKNMKYIDKTLSKTIKHSTRQKTFTKDWNAWNLKKQNQTVHSPLSLAFSGPLSFNAEVADKTAPFSSGKLHSISSLS